MEDNGSQIFAVGGLIVTIVVRRRRNNSLVATGFTTDAKGIADNSIAYFNNGGHFSTISRASRENPLCVFSISSSNHILHFTDFSQQNINRNWEYNRNVAGYKKKLVQ